MKGDGASAEWVVIFGDEDLEAEIAVCLPGGQLRPHQLTALRDALSEDIQYGDVFDALEADNEG